MTGFEPAASCSQSRRATNCATPGYFVILFGWSYSPKSSAIPASLHPDIQFLPLYHGGGENQRFFCLWSFMWSKPLLCRFRQSRKSQQTQVSQGFAAFHPDQPRIPPRHSQTTRATNCANPGFLVIEFCARCGQTCGHGDFLTTSACGGSACIVGVSRDCGHGIFRLEGGATRSQTRRDTNFAIPGYLFILPDFFGRCKQKLTTARPAYIAKTQGRQKIINSPSNPLLDISPVF